MTSEEKSKNNLGVATVTTDSFILGTLVTIHSFLKQNPWFDGEIVIIYRDLEKGNLENLRLLYDKIIFHKVSSQLDKKIEDFITLLPEFSARKARFFSLETFRLNNYEKVLFLDSDLLFRSSIEKLFGLPDKFIACGDAAFYEGKETTWVIKSTEKKNKPEGFHNTFNSGVMLIDNFYLTDENYAELLELINSRIFKKYDIQFTDQAILNMHFAGKQQLVSGVYNYLIAFQKLLYQKEQIKLQDACIIHFNGPYKPWSTEQVLKKSKNNLNFLKACGFWFEEYVECLQKLHLQKHTGNLFQFSKKQ